MTKTGSFRAAAKMLTRTISACAALCCVLSTPARAAEILTIELEAVFGQIGHWFEGDAPDSVDFEPGDVLSFVAVLTDLENTGVPSFRFAPTILQATATINGADFTFGNVKARTRASSRLEFDVLGDKEFTDETDFELTGSGPLLEGATFVELSFLNTATDFNDITSLAELLPYLRTDVVNINIFELIAVTGPGQLQLSGGTGLALTVTDLSFTLTDPEVVPLPAAFPLMAGGLAFLGAAYRRRRSKLLTPPA